MGSKDTSIATDRSLPIALLRARERVMGPVREILGDVGVTEQQWRVLRVLEEEGPIEPTVIARRAVLLLPSLTRILQKLESKGLLTRARAERDKRRQQVEITPAGRKLVLDNLAANMSVLEGFRAELGAEKYEQLLDLLDELTHGLDGAP